MTEKLYELTGKYLQLLELAQDPDVPEDVFLDTVEGLEGEIQLKAENVVKFIMSLEGSIEAVTKEIQRLTARKRTLQNRDDGIREYLRRNMDLTGISRIECSLFLISLAAGRPMVVIEDESAIPEEYLVVTTRPDKTKILADLKAGKEVPGCQLGTSKPSLRIR